MFDDIEYYIYDDSEITMYFNIWESRMGSKVTTGEAAKSNSQL